MLRRLARTTVALVAFFALQLVGAGGAAAACMLGDHGAVASGAAGATLGLDMPDMVMGIPSANGSDGNGGRSASAVPPGDDSSCDHGTVPERCMSAPACASFVPGRPAGDRDVAHALAHTRVAPLIVLAPASVSSPPDLRPPRA